MNNSLLENWGAARQIGLDGGTDYPEKKPCYFFLAFIFSSFFVQKRSITVLYRT
jgi:hypothetical protein